MAHLENFLTEFWHFGIREALARCLFRIAFRLSGATELDIKYPDDKDDHLTGIHST